MNKVDVYVSSHHKTTNASRQPCSAVFEFFVRDQTVYTISTALLETQQSLCQLSTLFSL